jgi:ferredoxin
MGRRLIVSVDTEKCMSHQLCIAELPEAFRLGPDHTAVVLPGASTLSEDQLIDAAASCPMAAIALHDEDGVAVAIH